MHLEAVLGRVLLTSIVSDTPRAVFGDRGEALGSCTHGPCMTRLKTPTAGVEGQPDRVIGQLTALDVSATLVPRGPMQVDQLMTESSVAPHVHPVSVDARGFLQSENVLVTTVQQVPKIEQLTGAIEEIPPTQIESGFYSHYFVAQKGCWFTSDFGLAPLKSCKFKMLRLKSMSQVRTRDWFVTIGLKDAYFHIHIVKRHWKFLRFAFKGKPYQYRILPFGLALAPWTFTKCMDAALDPLWLQGVRILNYLDDWLILAVSGFGNSLSRLSSLPFEELRTADKPPEECLAATSANYLPGCGARFWCNAGTIVSCTHSVITKLPESFQDRPSGPRRSVSQTDGSYGSDVPCCSAGPAPYETIPMVDQVPRDLVSLPPFLQSPNHTQRLSCSTSMDEGHLVITKQSQRTHPLWAGGRSFKDT